MEIEVRRPQSLEVEFRTTGGGTNDYERLINKPQINSVELIGNKSLEDLGIDLDSKADITYVDIQIENVEAEIPSLDGYATEEWVEDQGYLTEHQDISGKADISYVDEEIARVEDEIPTVPTNVSAFTNDAGYLTEHQSLDGYATEEWVEEQGYLTEHQSLDAYRTSAQQDIIDAGKQDTLIAGTNITISNNVISASGTGEAVWGSISGDIEDQDDLQHALGNKIDKGTLATVADTGDYEDLINTPTIPEVPTNVSEFVNDAGYITDADLSGYATETYVDSEIARVEAEIPTVPTNVSAFVNDAGYLTEHQSLEGYATENYVDTALQGKQNTLTAGTNITIVNDVISATGGASGVTDVTVDDVSIVTDGVAEIETQEVEIVTSVSSASTNSQLPTAKCLYDMVGTIEAALDEV